MGLQGFHAFPLLDNHHPLGVKRLSLPTRIGINARGVLDTAVLGEHVRHVLLEKRYVLVQGPLFDAD